MVIVRLVQGAMINAWETKALMISVSLVALYAIAVFLWGLADGRADARANPDPDRRADLAMTWLLAGLFAGVVSGLVAWFISLFYENLYVEALLNEVTTFAAFTALLTFLAAIAGVAVGHRLVDRPSPGDPSPRRVLKTRTAPIPMCSPPSARDGPDDTTQTTPARPYGEDRPQPRLAR